MDNTTTPEPQKPGQFAEARGYAACEHHWIGNVCSRCGVGWHIWAERTIADLRRYKERMEWLHDCSSGTVDSEGCEWGIYRVKWKDGRAVEVWQTCSDFSDLDAEMQRERDNVPISDGATKDL